MWLIIESFLWSLALYLWPGIFRCFSSMRFWRH
jgi:hypothetical protein